MSHSHSNRPTHHQVTATERPLLPHAARVCVSSGSPTGTAETCSLAAASKGLSVSQRLVYRVTGGGDCGGFGCVRCQPLRIAKPVASPANTSRVTDQPICTTPSLCHMSRTSDREVTARPDHSPLAFHPLFWSILLPRIQGDGEHFFAVGDPLAASVIGSSVGMPNRDLRVIMLQLFGWMPSLPSRASMAEATCSGATSVCRCWPGKVVTGHPRASASFLSVL